MATLSQAETFDKVVRMVIIGHHFARRLPLRVAGSTSTTATAKLTMHLIAASKHQRCAVRDARARARPPAYQVSALLTIMRISDPRPLHLTGFRTYAFSGNARLQHLPPFAAALPVARTGPQRRARVKFLWCAVCALARLLRRSGCRSDADGAGRGGWVRFRSRCPRS